MNTRNVLTAVGLVTMIIPFTESRDLDAGNARFVINLVKVVKNSCLSD